MQEEDVTLHTETIRHKNPYNITSRTFKMRRLKKYQTIQRQTPEKIR